jgi:hypothetical protein
MALALERRSAGRLPWWTMMRAIISGPVPRSVWRARMRTCMTCDLYSTVQPEGTTKRTDRLHLCKSTHPDLLGVGCGCAVNVSALTANPYGAGCVGRNFAPDLGWGPYHHPSLRARLWAPVRFFFGK